MSFGAHYPRPVTYEPGHRECVVCGRRVLGVGTALRHEGEAVTVITPDPEDAHAFTDAYTTAEAALDKLPPGATPADIARIVTQDLYARGLIRRRRARPRPGTPVVETLPDRYELPERVLARV